MENTLIKLNLFSNEATVSLESVISPLFSNLTQEPCADEIITAPETSQKSVVEIASDSNSNNFRCGLCFCAFLSLDEQRDHFQSDWHSFNVRRKLKSNPPLKEEDFESFLSENDNDSSDSDTEKSSNANLIQQKLKETGQIYFLTKENFVISCFRCLIFSPTIKEFNDEFLTETCRGLSKQTNWIVLSLAGGHFGGAVFENNEPVAHKTFSRYTVRAKQGGGQSAFDSQQNKAKSAGANLRRYNELSLCQDIRELLSDWKQHIRRCNFIFIRCSSYHKYIFFGGQNPAFDKSDVRLRSVPFNTHRPTFEEVRRIHRRLTTLICYGKSDEFLAAWNQKLDVQTQKSTPKTKKTVVKPAKRESSSEEELFWSGVDTTQEKNRSSPVDFTVEKLIELKMKSKKSAVVVVPDEISSISKDLKQKIYTFCKMGDVDELKEVLNASNAKVSDLITYFNSPLNTPDSPTYLHLASASGNCNLLRFLLEFGCDPTLKNADNQVPFQTSNGKLIRKEFSKFRDDFPDRYDWNKAQVPTLLDPETEALRAARSADKRKALRKVKAEKTKNKKEEEAQMKREEEEKKKYLNLSDREKRALAAERRILNEYSTKNVSAPILHRCFKCAADITGKIPFEYNEFRFCTIRCLQEHRKLK